jgi:hypothetical protein
MKIENQQSYIENGMFSGGVAVTPGSPIGFVAGGLYVGSIGDIAVTTVDGSALTFVSASGFIPGFISEVATSGTTATNIIALK